MKDEHYVVRHAVTEILGKGNLNRYEEFVANDIQIFCPESWNIVHTHEIISSERSKNIDKEYCKAFRFEEMLIHDLISFHDKIAVRWSGKGRHEGDFFSFPKSNRSFQVSGQTMYKLKEGKISHVWQAWDMLGLLSTLGFSSIPSPLSNDLKKRAARLSTREKQCLKHLLDAKTSKESAALFTLSPRTIEYYFENIKDKLDCATKRELFLIARILEAHKLL